MLSSRVMVFGTYDVFHPGHQYFISEAQKRGEELVVVIARDQTVKKIKPLLRNNELLRKKIVQESFPNATVILGDLVDHMKVVRDHQPSLVCLGYDQIGFSQRLIKDFPDIQIERIEAFHPEKYKSSLVANDDLR